MKKPIKGKQRKPTAAAVKVRPPVARRAKTTVKTARAAAKPAKVAQVAKAAKAAPSAKPVRAAVRAPAAKRAEPPVPLQAKKLRLSKEDANKYRKLLLDLRDHLIDGVSFLASDNLKRTARETTGELSGYGTHMGDAGTDNYDREFALSLVSNEQDGLYEIEEAMKRLEGGTYGVCELCEQAIRKERLEAIPFARFCVRCQATVEKDRQHPSQATTIFAEPGDDESGEGDESEES